MKPIDDFGSYFIDSSHASIKTIETLDDVPLIVGEIWAEALAENPKDERRPRLLGSCVTKDGQTAVIGFEILGKRLVLGIPAQLILDEMKKQRRTYH